MILYPVYPIRGFICIVMKKCIAMKKKISVFLMLFFCLRLGGQEKPDLSMMFWNLENFFDWRDDGRSDSDKEFSSYGARHWTRKKFYAKCEAVAKAVMWVGSREGSMPDVIGVAEVENRFVLERLVNDTVLRKYGYRIVHFESPDPRGIDLGLLYREDKLVLQNAAPLEIREEKGKELKTRDILLAEFRFKTAGSADGAASSDESFAVLVNHHPSKYGGAGTGWKRQAALRRLGEAADSLEKEGISNIAAAGDFNDTPDNVVLPESEGSGLVNLAVAMAKSGRGSIRYNGKWELIDMFMVSPELEPMAEMEIVEVPFLMVRDNVHAGVKPLRTYSGPRYLGGVSDHCPILLRICRKP